MSLSLELPIKKSPNHPLFLIACFFSALPIWLSTYPPMVDIPFFANQVATLLRLLSGTELLSPLLEINWFTPYLTGYIVVAWLGLFMPIVIAIKIVLSCAVIAIPWLASRLRALVSNDNSMDWIFLPVAYSFSFQYGFLNFIVGIPMILLFLRQAIIHFSSKNLNLKTTLSLIILSHLLFITHILALAFSLAIAIPIGIALSNNILLSFKNRSLIPLKKQDFLKFAPFFSSIPIIIVWLLHVKPTLFHLYNFHPSVSIWIINIYRFLIILSSATGFIYFYKLGAIYAMALFFLPGAKILKDWRSLPFIITISILLLTPTGSLGGNFIAERFNVFIFIFYIFSFDFSRMNSILSFHQRTILFSSLSCLILLTTAYKTIMFDKDTTGLKNSISKMEPHRRVATIIDDLGIEYGYSLFGSTSYWYHTEKNGYGNSFFSIPSSIIQFKANVTAPLPSGQFFSHQFNWNENANSFDYFIIRGNLLKLSPNFITGLKQYAQPIYHEGEWYLYSRKAINRQQP